MGIVGLIGLVVLAAAFIYGIMRNRARTARDKAATREGGEALYDRSEGPPSGPNDA